MHAKASEGFIAGCMSGQVHLGSDARDVVRLVHVVDLLAQVAQADSLVARLRRDELRQDPPQRLVLVVVVLELLQRGHERVPAALGDADREHDEERVEPVFSTMTPCSARKRVTIDAGMPLFANLPRRRGPGDDRRLDRVEDVESLRRLPKPCQLLVGAQAASRRACPCPRARGARAPTP
jgi:hypothetical protein